MNKQSLPNFNKLKQALDKTALKFHPSQAHGLICGLICGNKIETGLWEELILGTKKAKQVHALLQELYAVSVQQLTEFCFEFEVLLPEDEAPLSVRAEALVVWVQGLLTGLKLAQVPIVDREPSDMTEAINDLIEIAKMDHEQVLDNHEDEDSYIELVEFVRMATHLICEEIRDTKTKHDKHASRHLH